MEPHDVLKELRYYTPECPLSAYELAHKLGYRQSRESMRRRGREAFHAARRDYPDLCGSNRRGYYPVRTHEDRRAARDFLRGHALSELSTASLKRLPEQELLFG